MPFPNLCKSAEVLDDKTLADQFCLVRSLLLAFFNNAEVPGSCENWRGYDNALCMYGVAIHRELKARGYQYTDKLLQGYLCAKNEDFKTPQWFGDAEIHAYDRAFLLRKNPEHYKRFYWNVKNI